MYSEEVTIALPGQIPLQDSRVGEIFEREDCIKIVLKLPSEPPISELSMVISKNLDSIQTFREWPDDIQLLLKSVLFIQTPYVLCFLMPATWT